MWVRPGSSLLCVVLCISATFASCSSIRCYYLLCLRDDVPKNFVLIAIFLDAHELVDWRIIQMADSLRELVIHSSTAFLLANSDPLPLDQQSNPVPVGSSPSDPLEQPHSLKLAHALVSTGDESEQNAFVMEGDFNINNQGVSNQDVDDVLSDGNDSDGTDMIDNSKVESFETSDYDVNGRDSQHALQDEKRSKRAESWARARFNSWRALNNEPTTDTIEDLCARDMNGLGKLVGLFLTQVRKQNGKEYPPETWVILPPTYYVP